jgi:hypothetical protein
VSVAIAIKKQCISIALDVSGRLVIASVVLMNTMPIAMIVGFS